VTYKLETLDLVPGRSPGDQSPRLHSSLIPAPTSPFSCTILCVNVDGLTPHKWASLMRLAAEHHADIFVLTETHIPTTLSPPTSLLTPAPMPSPADPQKQTTLLTEAGSQSSHSHTTTLSPRHPSNRHPSPARLRTPDAPMHPQTHPHGTSGPGTPRPTAPRTEFNSCTTSSQPYTPPPGQASRHVIGAESRPALKVSFNRPRPRSQPARVSRRL
jgi:hypothetical protein